MIEFTRRLFLQGIGLVSTEPMDIGLSDMNLFKYRNETNYIIVHSSATPPEMNIGVDEIRRWHLERGWLDIGYHVVIRRNGVLEPGRALGVVGAHVKGHNHDSVGVCLVGGVDEQNRPENNFTPKQFVVLEQAIKTLLFAYEDAMVVGHRQFDASKACPSFDVDHWMVTAGLRQ